jgi:hypothetical protein
MIKLSFLCLVLFMSHSFSLSTADSHVLCRPKNQIIECKLKNNSVNASINIINSEKSIQLIPYDYVQVCSIESPLHYYTTIETSKEFGRQEFPVMLFPTTEYAQLRVEAEANKITFRISKNQVYLEFRLKGSEEIQTFELNQIIDKVSFSSQPSTEFFWRFKNIDPESPEIVSDVSQWHSGTCPRGNFSNFD